MKITTGINDRENKTRMEIKPNTSLNKLTKQTLQDWPKNTREKDKYK